MPADRSDGACTVAGVRSPSCILSVMVLRNSHPDKVKFRRRFACRSIKTPGSSTSKARSVPRRIGRVWLSDSKATPMAEPTKEQIIHRAYEIWEKNNKPEGRDEEFYHQAEQELRDEDKSSPLRTPDNL